ncbi:Dus-domain-containing protein [Phellopilus nigrolimitatus]|nr:Dus-domain-containing protein [Phellopilus nigrolimitatus]
MPGVVSDEHRPKRRKLSGGDLYRDVLGSPKLVVAPMVDQSELSWRILSRRYGAQLVYTPMINAKMFAESKHKSYKEQAFNLLNGEEGGSQDRPLIVQFAANDPDQLLTAAKLVEAHCDAVDINFGCPQDIARRGRYGCYLQDDWDLVYRLINTLHENLSIPVTAKFRVFSSLSKTVEYAKMMERAGAQILTCHGRTREQKGHNSGLADWDKIRAVKDAVSVPVFANGNVLFHDDIQRCLDATGADAIMTAEGNLYNPTVLLSAASFQGPSSFTTASLTNALSTKFSRATNEFFMLPNDTGAYLPHSTLALEYLAIVRALRTPTAGSAIKGHLFKLLRPMLLSETDLRDRLGRVRGRPGGDKDELLKEYEDIVREVEARLQSEIDQVQKGKVTLEGLVKVDESTGLRVLPRWLAQPYFRPLQVKNEQKEAKEGHRSAGGGTETKKKPEDDAMTNGVEG